ncbi:MAG: peptidoglycan-binding protein [Candidatus Moranbacteria bacterium]|nr:peptidoglycan-binding protein [Candidatus Moranbacteria bacterium]
MSKNAPGFVRAGMYIVAFLYFLVPKVSSAATNLLANPGAETGDFSGWTVVSGAGIGAGELDDGWGVGGAAHEGAYGFVSSYGASSPSGPFVMDVLSQEIDLVGAAGYAGSYLDTAPQIDASTYVIGADSGSGTDDPYRVVVELRDASHAVVASYDTGDQVADGTWQHISHTFTGYGSGVRYIYFAQKGRSSAWWAGQYGANFDDASVTVADQAAAVATETAVAEATAYTDTQKTGITSWKAFLVQDKSGCSQKLKLEIKGDHFKRGAKVMIGEHDASSVEFSSSKKLIARFCVDKLLTRDVLSRKAIYVKNPDVEVRRADKKIDLGLLFLLTSDTTNFDQDSAEGVTNIQKVLVGLKLLSAGNIVGVYGAKTIAAVKLFQEKHDISVTGNVGPLTIRAFQKFLH